MIKVMAFAGSARRASFNKKLAAAGAAKAQSMGAAFKGKVAGLFSASPGGLGGLRGLVHVRAILSGMGVFVVPCDLAVGGAHQAFADDGSLVDAKVEGRLETLVGNVLRTASALRAAGSGV